jgi:endoglucanase
MVGLVAICTGCAWLENPMPAPAPAATSRGPLGKPDLRHGMNLGNALDAPNEGDWGVVLDESDFSRIRRAGFDHVRLPVRFSAHASEAAPYSLDEHFLQRVDWAVARALASDLAVIVDFHYYDDLMSDPDADGARFVGLWKQISERYRSFPDAVCFELLNEPHGNLTAEKWNALLATALGVVRSTNPTRTVILEGIEWASAKNLRDTLRVPDDPNVVASFHMYQPILFTHQGADWMAPEFRTTGVQFPGPPVAPVTPLAAAQGVSWVREWFERYNHEPAATNPGGNAGVEEQLAMAAAFGEVRHLRVYMGEFGAIDKGDLASRARWTRLVRVEAEKRGFGWAYWDDGGGFKAYDRHARVWIDPLLAALRQ